MSETKLHDPEKEPWEVHTVFEDGSAELNDETWLKSVRQNPWYVLATLHGPLGKDRDPELTKKNRRAWNLWACQSLTGEERAKLAEEMELEPDELGGAWESERADIEKRFRERMGAGATLPSPDKPIDLSESYFPKDTTVSFGKYVFHDFANFLSSHFHATADFTSSHFHDYADFASSHFHDYAAFHSSHFHAFADFRSSHFHDYAAFTSSHFHGPTVFRSTVFDSVTVFRAVMFHSRAPEFRAAEIYPDTTFTLERGNWPTPPDYPDAARDDCDAYVRLKQLMTEAHKPDEAHFFLRRELRCKLKFEKKREKLWIAAYGLVSNFGYSIWRPVLCLAGLWALGWLYFFFQQAPACYRGIAFGPAECNRESLIGAIDAGGISFANIFAFFGFHRMHLSDLFEDADRWTLLVASAQSVFGVIFLFFLGLGLRNRFRLR